MIFSIPARGLIGLRTRLLERHAGHGRHPPPLRGLQARWPRRFPAGPPACWSRWSAGQAVAFGLDSLQERAELLVAPGDDVYEGMIVGENSRAERHERQSDQGKEAHEHAGRRATTATSCLKPARRMSLEEALEFIADDELVEVTPTQIRLRKILLKETDRRRAARAGA